MSGFTPGRVFAEVDGKVYPVAAGGQPLACTACGREVRVSERFSTDGVTTLHYRPECDPDWKPDPKPSMLVRLRRWVGRWI